MRLKKAGMFFLNHIHLWLVFSITIIETQDRNKEVASLTCAGVGAPGQLAGAYADAGNRLGKAIYKHLYPKEKSKKLN